MKATPKRFQPRGLSILHEDRDILVVDKVSGLLTVGTDKVNDHTAYARLNDYVRKGNHKSRNRVFIVHRLDKDTSGVIVFARNEKAKRCLQEGWEGFQKTYYAVVQGKLPEKEGVLVSHLAENRALRMYPVEDPGKGKLAKTGYKVLRESSTYSLLEIDLLTGRKHQIRVQLADLGFPVVGDKKYGEKEEGIKRLTLHAASLSLVHPHSGERMTFASEMPRYFESLMKGSPRVG